MSQQSDTYQQGIAITIIALNCLSFVSLCFVLGVYIFNWKSIASFPMRLSFYLCCACLGQNITVILLNPITIHDLEVDNKQATSSFCVFVGVIKVGFDLSSIIWTTLIIYSVYVSVTKKHNLEKFQFLYAFIGFLLPIGLACIPIAFNAYDFNDYYCWFRDQTTPLGFWLRIGYFFVPLWVLFGVNVSLALATFRQLKSLGLPQDILNVFKRLMLFPLIIFFTGIFATVDLIYSYSTKNQLNWLNFIGIFLLNLYGFFNSIAYGLNPIIRNRIELCFTKSSQMTFSTQFSEVPDFRSSRTSSQVKEELMELTAIKKVSASKSKI